MTTNKILARRTVMTLLTVVAVAIPGGAVAGPAAAEPAPTDTSASDSFERTISSGWGSANSGGAWLSSLASRTSVSSGQGRVSLASGQGIVQSLPASLTDMRTTVSVQVDSLPTAGNGMSAGIGARSSSTGAYVATLRFGRAGAASLNIVRQRAGSPDVMLVSDALLPMRAVAGTPYTAQVDVTGTSPVQVRARAWPASTTAPSWQVSTSDGDTSRIVTAGGASLRSYLSASTAPLRVGYDNLLVQKLVDGTAPTPPTPPTPPAAPPNVGSAPIGSTNYPVPAGAVYVTASGSRTGSGTASSPYGSLAYAIEKANSGSTIVMRGGSYRESTVVPFYKRLTIQSYPGESVWLEGSSVVSGWQRAGNTWIVSGWNYIFDHRVSHNQGVDESNRFVDPAYPMAGHPDQVWVSGTRLRQVGSAGAVVSGTFFVDESARRLIIGSDPTGKQVEASTRQQAMVVVGEGTTIRGIGIRRYANTFWMGGALSAQVNNISVENVHLVDNATTGLNGWAKNLTLNRVTLANNGVLGLGLNRTDDLRLSNSLIQGNNLERFKEAPVSGGAKITTARRVSITNNVFERNTTAGLWFDMDSYDLTITKNRVSNNGGTGIALEASSKIVVAGNYLIGNGKAGVEVGDTNNVNVWNNTFSGNQLYTLRIYQDFRRSSDPVITYVVRDVAFRNNVLAYGTGPCPYLVHDMEQKVNGQALRVTSQSNAYYRASSSSPANMVCWANGSAGLASFKTLTTFRAATGNDMQSTLNEGTPILTSAYQLTPAALSSTSGVALPIPDGVASLLGVPANTRKLGPVSPML